MDCLRPVHSVLSRENGSLRRCRSSKSFLRRYTRSMVCKDASTFRRCRVSEPPSDNLTPMLHLLTLALCVVPVGRASDRLRLDTHLQPLVCARYPGEAMSMSAGKSEGGKRGPVQQHRALNMVVSVVLWCFTEPDEDREPRPAAPEGAFPAPERHNQDRGLGRVRPLRVLTAGERSVGSLLVIQGRLSIACRGCLVVGQVPALAAAVAVVEQDRAAGEPALPGVPP